MQSPLPDEELLELIEAAATDDDAWADVLALVTAECGGHKAMIYWVKIDPALADFQGPMWGYLHGFNPDEVQMLDRMGIDPFVRSRGREMREGPFTGAMVQPEEQYWQSAPYRRWGRQLGFGRTLGFDLGRDDPEDVAELVVLRRREDPGFDAHDLGFMARIAPGVRRSARLASARFRRDEEIEVWKAIDEARGGGHLVMADHGALMHANPMAMEVLGEAPLGARLADGRPLGAALLEVTGPVSLLVMRHDGAPLAVEARPLPRSFGAERRPSISVTFQRPDRPRVTADLLRQRWDLTPAQGALALALLDGVTPEAHSTERGVSLTTTRSHLKALREKLGAGTTAQAVAILARGVG